MKAFLIARVSTDEQSDALPGQIYRLKDYAARKNFACELFEIRESAYKGNRASFKEIIDKIVSQPDISILVFDKIDRYTRNSNSNEVSLLNNLCRAGKIEIHFPSDSLYISKSSSAQEHFMLNMGVSTAQYYSDSISDNVKRRNQQKLRDGEWCGKAPIGYLNTVKDGKKWVEPDLVKASLIRKTFEMYASGNHSLLLIAKKWRDEYGVHAGSSRIDQLLKNPFYYGEMRVKGEIYPHKYEPLISYSLFEQAKRVREGYKVKPHRWGGLPFPYRGLIKCTECGCSITFETKKGKYTYGHCTRKKNRHNLTYVNQDKITEQVLKILRAITIPQEAYLQVSEALRMTRKERRQQYQEDLVAIEAEIKKYQLRKERVYEDYLDSRISDDLYTRKFDEFSVKLRLNQERKKSLELASEDQYTTVSYLLKLANNIENLFLKANLEQKRSILNLVVSNLELDDSLLRWKYKKPFETMAFCNNNSTWLRRLDSNQ